MRDPPSRTPRRVRWAQRYWGTQPKGFREGAEGDLRGTHYSRIFRVVRDWYTVSVGSAPGNGHLRRLTKAAEILFSLGDDDEL